MFRYHLHEQEQQLENNGGGEIGDDKFCGIEKVVQVTFILHWEGNLGTFKYIFGENSVRLKNCPWIRLILDANFQVHEKSRNVMYFA